jgi:hypothetical protein
MPFQLTHQSVSCKAVAFYSGEKSVEKHSLMGTRSLAGYLSYLVCCLGLSARTICRKTASTTWSYHSVLSEYSSILSNHKNGFVT